VHSYGRLKSQDATSFYPDIDWRIVFKFYKNLVNGKSVKSCVIYFTKRNKILPGSQAVATAWIVPSICQGQPPAMYWECSRFHSNRLTFGGVIAERVNTTKTRRRVNPVFGWSVALSQIIKFWILLAASEVVAQKGDVGSSIKAKHKSSSLVWRHWRRTTADEVVLIYWKVLVA